MSRVAADSQRINQIRYPVVDTSEIMEIGAEIVEEIPSRVVNDTIYVAVGKDFKESQSILRWALHNSGGKPICIFHVHQPAEKIPIMGTKFRINQLEGHHVAAHHEKERQDMLKLLERYNQICQGSGVVAEVQYIERGCIEKGIVELIMEHNVTRLVMGAAADKYYSRRMVEVRSSKAMYVRLQAAAFCHIQFICKGNVIFTRKGQMPRSASVHNTPTPTPTQDYRRVMSSPNTWSPSSDDYYAITQQNPSPPSLQERGMNDELYDQLVQAMAEADNSKRDAFEESLRRRKAERDAIEAKRRLKTSENLYAQELRQRQETDESLEKTKEQHGNIEKELHQVAQELRMALEHKSLLQSQIADSDQTVRDLEHKMFAAVDLLQNYKKERDELQIECDDALRLVEQLRADEASTSNVSQYYTEFDFTEVKDATHNFDPSLKIGEGGYGSIYRGFVRHTEVAIKMLHSHSLQGPSEFQQEVNVLSKLRHPNLVTLIGACPDAWIIIYEYLSGGSLEDRLNCKDNTPPLSWQNRIRVAAELCSVLIFLHSCGVVHGDLKPANILLDKNLVSKLSDFGICRVLDQNEFTINNTSRCCRTDPKGTFVYMDPEFLSTGELTSKSDTYSFGIILLRLLTGRPALGLTKEVRYALDKEDLKSIVDPTAGDWPFVQAQQLALLAMDCCDIYRKNRPDLASEAWRVLEPMRVSCGLSSFREGLCHIPHYFVCPIFQEIMQDPVVAADGFTYEAEALKGWLDSGHNTSPMTNLDLPNTNLVQNHALRSAIQEWLHQP